MSDTMKFQRIDEHLNTLRAAFETLTHKEPREATIHNLNGATGICAINMVVRGADVIVTSIEGDYEIILDLAPCEVRGRTVTDLFGADPDFVAKTLRELNRSKFVFGIKHYNGKHYHSLLLYFDSTHIKEMIWYA